MLFGIGVLVSGVLLVGASAAPTFILATCALTAGQLVLAVPQTIEEAWEQEFSSDAVRGKVLATISAIATGGYLIGITLAPTLTDWISARIVLAVSVRRGTAGQGHSRDAVRSGGILRPLGTVALPGLPCRLVLG